MSQAPKSVALVGRPNVGKSRLFNRILGRRVSIVHDKPGVTRDIVVEPLSANLSLMDTGGMGATASGDEKIIASATNTQARFAVDTADTIIFVVDSKDGLTALDEDIAQLLRSSGKDVILVVNKVDVPDHSDRNADFYRLGFKDVAEVSAEHGIGIDAITAMLETRYGKIEPLAEDADSMRVKICVAGRPNVGKSSIANRLLGEERLIVSKVAGTTRDSVKMNIDAVSRKGEEMQFTLFDTAGLKTNRKTNTSLDYLSSVRTRKAISASDVVFLVIDAMEGVSDLDKRLVGEIVESGASVVIVVNKWDYAEETFKANGLRGYENIADFRKNFEDAVRYSLPSVADAPMYFVSAIENKGIDRLLEAAHKLKAKMLSNVTTNKLNAFVSASIDANPPKYSSGKRFKAYYCVKVASRPYTIRIFCNSVGTLSDTYRRYLVKDLKSRLSLGGVSLKLELVGKPRRTAEERIERKRKREG